MEVGIIGLPVSGKTTLFATLTGQAADAGFGGGKLEVHRGIVKVPDERLDKLSDIFQPKKQVNATIEYIEVGGLDSDAGSRGFDSQFLQVLKTTDTLCVVVRGFDNEFHPHPAGSVDPARDIRIVESEFILSDLTIVETRIERLEKQLMKIKDDKNQRELELLKRCTASLEGEHPLREMTFSAEEKAILRGYQFLSAKPVVYVINFNESDIAREAEILAGFAVGANVTLIGLCGKVELEISQLEDEDRNLFMEELGIAEPASNKLIRTCYEFLGLQCFFTVGEDECRAWTIRENTAAPSAAGVIHSDLERGFIRAEVVSYKDFIALGSLARCRDEGKLRLEGKNYVVQNGDIMNIRFNV